MDRPLDWFKTGIQWNAKFTGFKVDQKYKIPTRCWNRMTVFATRDRRDAIDKVVEEAGKYGYKDVTVDHITRIG